jgi:hypothetical protein
MFALKPGQIGILQNPFQLNGLGEKLENYAPAWFPLYWHTQCCFMSRA